MLVELDIHNFAIIDKLTLPLSPGFNVLTGETGAGKSIIIDAVSLLLGGRADSSTVRAGTDQARIEGVFILDSKQREALRPSLEELGLEDAGDALILTRELSATGRSVGRINGRAVTVKALQEIGERLVDIHGQSEHLSLLRVRTHIDLLDRYAGLADLREQVAATVRELNNIRHQLATLRRDARELARRVDLLEFQVQEIQAAKLKPGEEEALAQERVLLTNAERLLALSTSIYQSLYAGDGEQQTALDLLNSALRDLCNLEKLDPRLAEQRQIAETAVYALEDLAHAIRDYRDNIEYNPARLAQIEERLDLIFRLKRKYGESIPEILAFGERAAQELESISHSEERIQALETEEQVRLAELAGLAQELSAARQAAAANLARAVEQELENLRMSRTRFEVNLERVETPDGIEINGKRFAFDATGIDRVEFLISPNPGEPLKPLVKIASGGETSRLMLALKTVLASADTTPTLIFDEIDSGIGGRVGEIVGRKLWELTQPGSTSVSRPSGHVEHQVICVTHLPQIAVYGDAHFQISKSVVGERTLTQARLLDGEERIDEIMQMLGSSTEAARQTAAAMLDEVQQWKPDGTAAWHNLKSP